MHTAAPMENFFQQLGLIAGVLMPFFNIPLMVRIYKRKSAEDISLWWLFGVWGSILAMLPSCLQSDDITLKAFGISNSLLFSVVVVVVLVFRRRKPEGM